MGQQVFIFGRFLGSAVEATEALTIVLAVGLTRGASRLAVELIRRPALA